MQILMELNTSAIPANISKTVRNNAGGAWNHLSYFKVGSAGGSCACRQSALQSKRPYHLLLGHVYCGQYQ